MGALRCGGLTPGCPERLDWAFLTYVRRFRRDHRPKLLTALAGFPGRIIVLRGPKDVVAAFIRGLPPSEGQATSPHHAPCGPAAPPRPGHG